MVEGGIDFNGCYYLLNDAVVEEKNDDLILKVDFSQYSFDNTGAYKLTTEETTILAKGEDLGLTGVENIYNVADELLKTGELEEIHAHYQNETSLYIDMSDLENPDAKMMNNSEEYYQ